MQRRPGSRTFRSTLVAVPLVISLCLLGCRQEKKSFLEEAKAKCNIHGGVERVYVDNLGHRAVICRSLDLSLPGHPHWSFTVRESEEP
jgi:hypothetical protein